MEFLPPGVLTHIRSWRLHISCSVTPIGIDYGKGDDCKVLINELTKFLFPEAHAAVDQLGIYCG